MAASDPEDSSSSQRLRWIIGILLAGVLIWVTFFDSHSLLRRYQWHQERDALEQENEKLRTRIRRLRKKLDRPLPDSVVERIAREEHGMKRPDETIYRIESE